MILTKKILILFLFTFLIISFLKIDISYARSKSGGSVSVSGYHRKDGTYVKPHRRSAPYSNFNNNWSTKGNINPYTGEEGSETINNIERKYETNNYNNDAKNYQSHDNAIPESNIRKIDNFRYCNGIDGKSWYTNSACRPIF